jgi:cell division protein FtsW
VLFMFILLAFAFLRVMRGTTNLQVRVTTASVMVWVIGQALVNIGVVLGVFPVLGVPLPLISAGGTALLTTLLAIGIVLSFARGSHAGDGAGAGAGARAGGRALGRAGENAAAVRE